MTFAYESDEAAHRQLHAVFCVWADYCSESYPVQYPTSSYLRLLLPSLQRPSRPSIILRRLCVATLGLKRYWVAQRRRVGFQTLLHTVLQALVLVLVGCLVGLVLFCRLVVAGLGL